MVGCGVPYVSLLPIDLASLFGDRGGALRIGYSLAQHAPYDCREHGPAIAGSVLRIDYRDGALAVRNEPKDALRPQDSEGYRLRLGTGNTAQFSLAYGPDLHAREAGEDFEFSDPNFRVTRYASLFDPDALLTDPIRFLERLHYRAVRCGRFPAKRSLESLAQGFAEYLNIDTAAWREKGWEAAPAWCALAPWQQRAALPAIDAARHMMDAFVRSGTPLQSHGVMLFDRPDRYCTARRFPAWVEMMDRLFPLAQFILTLPQRAIDNLPVHLRQGCLALPEAAKPVRKTGKSRSRIKQGSVLLYDVDSRLPNLALMKLSRYFKAQGKETVLAGKAELPLGAEAIYASSVFSLASSKQRVDKLHKFYGDSLVVGGSGVDLRKRLPPEAERGEADYSLYPELGDRAMGFPTRGCPYRCPFCLVPQKEGDVHIAEGFDSLLQGRKKLILLDDNILAHTKAGELFEEMVRRDLSVNFTQTLDIRLLDAELTELLKRIRSSNTRFTRQVYYFSLNGVSGLRRIRDNYARFGFRSSDNVEFVCMYGFDTTLREDVERFRFIRSLPGAYVFVQQYQPVLVGPQPPEIEFFGERSDELIDSLLEIEFTQNMKSMEKYYRWLSKRYAERYGRLHKRLVDTIFRYNRRDAKGRYLVTLAGTRPLASRSD
ncbi:MAG: hypothetical protein GY701_13865 [Sulfitobacter sp.]|nr:hypothetical protein [Sulfitobacter sp.]